MRVTLRSARGRSGSLPRSTASCHASHCSGIAAAEVAVALLSDAQVQVLNRDFRGQDKPTNVLSFPQTTPATVEAGSPRPLGDLALAYETTAREAVEAGIGIADHVRHLVVHGVLHLLGHDHVDDEEALLMEGLEIEILAALGVANPYARQDDEATAEVTVAGDTSR